MASNGPVTTLHYSHHLNTGPEAETLLGGLYKVHLYTLALGLEPGKGGGGSSATEISAHLVLHGRGRVSHEHNTVRVERQEACATVGACCQTGGISRGEHDLGHVSGEVHDIGVGSTLSRRE